MTALLLTALLVVGLLASALAGPAMLRSATPALVRTPRHAATLLGVGAVVWPLALLGLGPVLAWGLSGPRLVPGEASEVCQRCLAQANPLPGPILETAIPVILLVALPAVAAGLLATGLAAEFLRRDRRSRRDAARVLGGAVRRSVLGHEVYVVDAARPFALTFPARHGGVVLSTAALEHLDHGELGAVLVHERAHLRQRHHVVSAVVAGVARWLRWIPLIAAIEDALPHYLEIAADDEARREAGTPALVGALLTLGGGPPELAGALHAAGPERIRELVQPTTGAVGVLPTVAATVFTAALGLAALAVHLPYLASALTGCL